MRRAYTRYTRAYTRFVSARLKETFAFLVATVVLLNRVLARENSSAKVHVAEPHRSFFAERSYVSFPGRFAENLTWVQVNNICLNGSDYVRSLSDLPRSDDLSVELKMAGINDVTDPFRVKSLDWDASTRSSAVILHGNSIVVQCWRSPRPQPSHFMFAYGKLYSFFVTFNVSRDQEQYNSLDNVVFHQCIRPDKAGEFFEVVWKIVRAAGHHSGALNSGTKYFTTSVIDTANICVRRAHISFDSPAGLSLGRNSARVVDSWKSDVAHYLGTAVMAQETNLSQSLSYNSTPSACAKHIRIRIFQRYEGNGGLRKFKNMDDVVELAKEFSLDTKIMTIGSKSTFLDAYRSFNDFDVLITPHGSHLTNGIFIKGTNTPSIIEVVGTCINLDFHNNLGEHFAIYKLSTGHSTQNEDIDKKIAQCERRASCSDFSTACSFGDVRMIAMQDLVVDKRKLRSQLSQAVHVQCSTLAV